MLPAPSAERSSPPPAVAPTARLGAHAWAVVAAAAAFFAITCWWLSEDRSVPIFDAGYHLLTAVEFHNMLQAGNLLGPIDHENVYPPLAQLVGALAMFIGGVSVAAPIVGENVVFLSLLALGVYQTARLLYGPTEGMLAVVFALAAPLTISLFHVFMLDTALTALVAVSIWLILASEDFARVGTSALAGLAVGAGMNVKVQLALYVAGVVVTALAHGGWRNRRGFLTFALVALAVGLPWYVVHLGELGELASLAGSGPGVPASDLPPLLSIHNLLWYFWSVLNVQLLVPLFLLALVGVAWATVALARARAAHAARLEFLAGGAGAWVLLTFATPVHDPRYSLPLLAYIAVIATAWIPRAPRPARVAAGALLACAVCASVLGLDLGVGREVELTLGSDHFVLYTTNGFLASAPERDGDVPALLSALRREGVHTVAWGLRQSEGPDFSYQGVDALVMVAGLTPYLTEGGEYLSHSPGVATLLHEPVSANAQIPCTRLSDGTGVWVVRFDRARHALAMYCPTHKPRFYGSVAVS